MQISDTFTEPEHHNSIPLILLNVRRIVEEHFPGLWFYVEAILATISTLFIEDIKDPASLILDGPPSSRKGTAIDSIKDHKRTYWSDKFTPAAFVSQAANKSEKDLKKIDLLPRIKDKALVVPELAPIFKSRSDILKQNIATLTRVFDGEGYTTDAGTGGRRGYQGEYRFVLIGATTPPSIALWRILGKLGNRLCFLKISAIPTDNIAENLARSLREEAPYKEKLGHMRETVGALLNHLESLGPMKWNRANDPPDIVEKIVAYAKLSGSLRGTIQSVKVRDSGYDRGFTIIEGPERFATLLYNLARGRALVNGRKNIDKSDLELVREVALSSCVEGRYRLVKHLISRGGEVSTLDIESLLGCSKSHALDLMEDLEILGVVKQCTKTLLKGGFVKMITISDQYWDLLLY